MYCNSFEGIVNQSSTVTAGTTGTGEQTLATYTLPANSLYKTDQNLRIRAYFTHAANTNGVTFKLYFGATSISSGSLTTSGQTAELALDVVRTGSATQAVWASGKQATTSLASAYTAGTDDFTTALTIKATVTGGTTGADGSLILFRVEFLQNP